MRQIFGQIYVNRLVCFCVKSLGVPYGLFPWILFSFHSVLSDPSLIIGYACHIGNSLLQILELTFGPKTKLFSDFEHKGWSRF